MIYLECPDTQAEIQNGLFLAGGITGCADWQARMVRLLQDTDYTILNPRRVNFPIADPDAALEQIRCEFRHMRLADQVLFWFSPETLNPIALFELGAWSMTRKPLFVGAHPEYKRRRDVVIQLALARPDVAVASSIGELAKQVRNAA